MVWNRRNVAFTHGSNFLPQRRHRHGQEIYHHTTSILSVFAWGRASLLLEDEPCKIIEKI